jgi:CRISPR/Cas system type I-B associated protein Csh2 (Cas7 group RAMP superfamily)
VLFRSDPIDKNNPRKLRFVVQESGQLKAVSDASISRKVRKPSTDSVDQKRWNDLYWAAKRSNSKAGSTFNQLSVRFKKEFGKYPPRDLYNMPTQRDDWKRGVRDVDYRDLVPRPVDV